MTTTTEITAALDAQRAFLLDLLAHLCGDEAWQYAEQTLGIPSSWNAFQAWWKAQPEHDEVAQAKMRANGHRAAAVQQARRARGSAGHAAGGTDGPRAGYCHSTCPATRRGPTGRAH